MEARGYTFGISIFFCFFFRFKNDAQRGYIVWYLVFRFLWLYDTVLGDVDDVRNYCFGILFYATVLGGYCLVLIVGHYVFFRLKMVQIGGIVWVFGILAFWIMDFIS